MVSASISVPDKVEEADQGRSLGPRYGQSGQSFVTDPAVECIVLDAQLLATPKRALSLTGLSVGPLSPTPYSSQLVRFFHRACLSFESRQLYVEGEPSPFCTSEEHDPMIHRVVDGRRFRVLTPAAGGFSFFVEDRCGLFLCAAHGSDFAPN